MHYQFISIILISFFLVFACSDQKTSEKKDEISTDVEKDTAMVSPPDSIFVSVAVKGKRNRMSLLQQKVMLRAKKKLADSLISLRNYYADTTIADIRDYEVVIHDIHVIKEGVRYPEKNNPSVVETYITIAMKYEKPELKE